MNGTEPSGRFGIRADAGRMWFDALPHEAVKTGAGWSVSWLEGRDDLTVEQAREALGVAKLSNTYRLPENARRDWPQIRAMAAGLGVDPREAVRLVRSAEARARAEAIPTPFSQLPHLAAHLDRHPDADTRVIQVDRPAVTGPRTPGRVAGQWVVSGHQVAAPEREGWGR